MYHSRFNFVIDFNIVYSKTKLGLFSENFGSRDPGDRPPYFTKVQMVVGYIFYFTYKPGSSGVWLNW